MRILHILLIMNLVSALTGVFAVILSADSKVAAGLCIAVAVAAIVGLSYAVAHQFQMGLKMIEQAVASAHEGRQSRIHEFKTTWKKLGHYAQRWSVAANRSREQNKNIDWLVDTLERRSSHCGNGSDTSDAGLRVRRILTGISHGADAHLQQIMESVEQVQSSVKGMSDVASSNGGMLAKTTSHVEHLSQSIVSVSAAASTTLKGGKTVEEKIQLAQNELKGHIAAMRRIQAGVESSESRLRAMLSHTREIGAIANSISDISSRTDMLALNLSIESARSNSSGSRGSSNVAEEVRRLAEQAAHAAQEVTGLVESVQLETQESISTIAQQNKDLNTELPQVEAANSTIEDAASDVSRIWADLAMIGKASNEQIRLANELVSAVEEMSRISSVGREASESALWNAGSMAAVASQFAELLEPLRDVCLPIETRKDLSQLESDQIAATECEPENRSELARIPIET